MDEHELLRRLMPTFLQEVEEHLRTLSTRLLELEHAPAQELEQPLAVLLRTAHTLKGAARAVNVEPIADICHQMESMLQSVRDQPQKRSPTLIDTLLGMVDQLAAFREELAREHLVEQPPTPQPEPSRPAPSEPRPDAQTGHESDPVEPTQDIVRLTPDKLDALATEIGDVKAAGRTLEQLFTPLNEFQQVLRTSQAGVRDAVRWLQQLASDQAASNRQRIQTLLANSDTAMRDLQRGLERLADAARSNHRHFTQVADELGERVVRLRLVRFDEVSYGLARTVRDALASRQAQGTTIIEGGHVEFDRSLTAGLREMMLHLAKNAAMYGIETPEERTAAGKPAQGTITATAEMRGGRLRVTVEDDGRGLDVHAIRERAAARNLEVPDSDAEVADLIFQPGFSTAGSLSVHAGRGLGLDIVRSRAQSMRGSVRCEFQPGRGTRFILDLPVTLTSIQALVVRLNQQLVAIDTSSLTAAIRIEPSRVKSVHGTLVLLRKGDPLPLFWLEDMLGFDPTPNRSVVGVSAICLKSGDEEIACIIDEVVNQLEVLVEPLSPRLRGIRHLAGTTHMPDDELAFLLNGPQLVQSALASGATARSSESKATSAAKRNSILLVDDSVTTRTLIGRFLKDSGYDIYPAPDGAAALRVLQERRDVDLVISDVQMPNMDGLSLAATIRKTPAWRDLPVILVTSLETDAEKEQGMRAGADAYLRKSTFDHQELLALVSRLLEEVNR